MPSDDGAEPGAAADLAAGLLAFALALAFDIGRGYFVHHPGEADGSSASA